MGDARFLTTVSWSNPSLQDASVMTAVWWLAAVLVASGLLSLIVGWQRRRRRDQVTRQRIDDRLQELARRRAELRDLEADRSRFLAAFSHDLKQPMQAVNLYLGSIERSLVTAAMTSDERARATESLLRLQQSIGYMNDVFDSVLDISRLDSGAMEVRMERVHAWSFCERVLAQHQRMADDLGLVLELRGVDASQMALKTDPRLLERILRNFISNAMRYTKRGGLRLRIAQHGVLCRISIVDTGSGIAAPLRKKIFDEFTRGDAAAMAAQGVGLGLAIARRLSARIGGRILLSSHVGLGSVFAIELPLSAASLLDAERAAMRDAHLVERLLPQVVVEPPVNTLMVCIDADPDVANALRLLAPGLGIDIITAGGSVDAIRQLAMRGLVPSLLMIDAQLQSESVAQVITLINDEFNTTVPVVLCSDEALVANIEQHAGSPVTLLQRPFSTEKLREAINAALSGWSARQG
jgi:signal transduction histidine kinase/CheY-like chemotaxis protein